jgi:5-bromo-4-chloroindolyl phosphate hydrolysis protein
MTEKELRKIEQSIIGGLNTLMDLMKTYYYDEATPNDVFEPYNDGFRVIPKIYDAIKEHPHTGKKVKKQTQFLNRKIISDIFPVMAN